MDTWNARDVIVLDSDDEDDYNDNSSSSNNNNNNNNSSDDDEQDLDDDEFNLVKARFAALLPKYGTLWRSMLTAPSSSSSSTSTTTTNNNNNTTGMQAQIQTGDNGKENNQYCWTQSDDRRMLEKKNAEQNDNNDDDDDNNNTPSNDNYKHLVFPNEPDDINGEGCPCCPSAPTIQQPKNARSSSSDDDDANAIEALESRLQKVSIKHQPTTTSTTTAPCFFVPPPANAGILLTWQPPPSHPSAAATAAAAHLSATKSTTAESSSSSFSSPTTASLSPPPCAIVTIPLMEDQPFVSPYAPKDNESASGPDDDDYYNSNDGDDDDNCGVFMDENEEQGEESHHVTKVVESDNDYCPEIQPPQQGGMSNSEYNNNNNDDLEPKKTPSRPMASCFLESATTTSILGFTTANSSRHFFEQSTDNAANSTTPLPPFEDDDDSFKKKQNHDGVVDHGETNSHHEMVNAVDESQRIRSLITAMDHQDGYEGEIEKQDDDDDDEESDDEEAESTITSDNDDDDDDDDGSSLAPTVVAAHRTPKPPLRTEATRSEDNKSGLLLVAVQQPDETQTVNSPAISAAAAHSAPSSSCASSSSSAGVSTSFFQEIPFTPADEAMIRARQQKILQAQNTNGFLVYSGTASPVLQQGNDDEELAINDNTKDQQHPNFGIDESAKKGKGDGEARHLRFSTGSSSTVDENQNNVLKEENGTGSHGRRQSTARLDENDDDAHTNDGIIVDVVAKDDNDQSAFPTPVKPSPSPARQRPPPALNQHITFASSDSSSSSEENEWTDTETGGEEDSPLGQMSQLIEQTNNIFIVDSDDDEEEESIGESDETAISVISVDSEEDDESIGKGGLESPVVMKRSTAASKKKNILRDRERLAQETFRSFDERVFQGRLGVHTSVSWSNKLRTTAGLTRLSKKQNGSNAASIELSTKVVDDISRLRSTLMHEMCHVAAFLLDDAAKETAHGPSFKKWGKHAMRIIPDIVVTTKHDYQIQYKYAWSCTNTNCGVLFQRHSRSIDVTKQVCGKCKSRLMEIEVPGPEDTSQTPRKPRAKAPPSVYNRFVQDNSASIRQRLEKHTGSHGKVTQSDVMKECARLWRLQKDGTDGDC